uniref:AMP-dependent synthetase/ligase domain-containing protein n=1 Tax=Plectus sambesii TaxID=2011161 RepID=A0A914W722_9BILA
MSQAKGPTDLPLIQKTIAQAFAATCADNGPKLAIHFTQENVHMTFAKLLTEVEKLATGLRVSGLQVGDHVALWGGNYANMLVSIYACCRAGFVFSCLNPALSKSAVLKSLAMGDFRAVICFPTAHPGESYRTLADLCPELRNCAKGHLSSRTLVKLTHVIMAEEDHTFPGTYTLSEIYGKGTLEELKKIGNPPTDPNAVATIQFSMGTTGEPKPVLLI